jgi:antitoxin component YwqK of YwqJK toxin-antitoxin module
VFTAGNMASTVSAAGKGFYDDGRQEVTRFDLGSKKTDLYRIYSEEGKLLSEYTFVKGQLQ